MSGYLSGRTSLTTVQTADIAADAVTAAKIPAGAIGSSEIAADAVGSSEIAADAVGASEIAANAVDASEITALTGALDINGQELILDADGNTSITADTDNQIDFKLAGADDFRMTANNFNVLSGSTLTVDSGATITNSGTATNFGTDSESAYAGVLETNANFVNQVIFGPAVDGMSWKGLWNKASVFSSLMLATLEDTGSNSEINIWDMTAQSAGVISTTPLATVALSGDATPTSIAAAMGYIIVGSEDGVSIIDPHDGTWAERTTNWPKSLSTSTLPALAHNDVTDVAATFNNHPAYDPRTKGPMPTFLMTTNGQQAIMHHTGEVYSNTSSDSRAYIIGDGRGGAVHGRNGGTKQLIGTADLDLSTNYISNSSTMGDVSPGSSTGAATYFPILGGDTTALDATAEVMARGSAGGIDITLQPNMSVVGSMANCKISRTYNTGFFPVDCQGAWINDTTDDYGKYDNTGNGNSLTENGTVPYGAVESGAEMKFAGPFSTTNYFSHATNDDWATIATGGEIWMSAWVKSASCVGTEAIMGFSNSGGTIRCTLTWGNAAGDFTWELQGSSATVSPQTGEGFDDDVWHKVDCVQVHDTLRYIYVDGVRAKTSTTAAGSFSSSGNLPFAIGRLGGSSGQGATTSKIAMARFSKSAPDISMVRRAYELEKGIFATNAECLLQSGSTNNVLDVSVDPLTNKILVTQTDAITIFEGAVVSSKPTVNSGTSEKGKLWGDLRVDQNSANIYVTAPAVDQRQVNEMVRGLASDLPAGVDLSKAKAWIAFNGATPLITASYNVKSLTRTTTGTFKITFGIPFKSSAYNADGYTGFSTSERTSSHAETDWVVCSNRTHGLYYNFSTSGSGINSQNTGAGFFGELENE